MTKDKKLYLDLMKRILVNYIFQDGDIRGGPYNDELRYNGQDWPRQAHTMIGMRRLNNLQFCIEDVLERNIPGDFIECGVWRGGACIFMKAILQAYEKNDRIVWVADSFEGVPEPEKQVQDAPHYQADLGNTLYLQKVLKTSFEEVLANFANYGVFDENIKFLKGWFKDTLHKAPINSLAILRLDGDLYGSTWDCLTALYDKLVVGGYIIIDDYGGLLTCQNAVNDFRAQRKINEPILMIDHSGAFWKKEVA
jgi:hypothetical protein